MSESSKKVILEWDEYIDKARETVAEGCVLLKNDNNVLPLSEGTRVSLFGRMQKHYYKSGVGSGGMVNVDSVIGILDGIERSGKLTLNGELIKIYTEWERDNLYDEGCGWGNEPWSQPEMPLTDEIVKAAAEVSDVAIAIIARTAGEDRDAGETPGSYLLTEIEMDMLARIRKFFSKVVVLVNSGGIIDMEFIDKCSPDSVLMVWQGGMTGGDGVADLLTGERTPSGKLVDTIAYNIKDYPASTCFGSRERNYYCEDVYVGYRYFETFAKQKVRYPFGFGMSYTSFDVNLVDKEYDEENMQYKLSVSVRNTGSTFGKEVVQIYGEAPQGLLGKPARQLLAFAKTRLLKPDEIQILTFNIDAVELASFDDSGVTGNKCCFVLEPGSYNLYVGTDVRSAFLAASFGIGELAVTKKLEEAYAPVRAFDRIKPVAKKEDEYGNLYEETYEAVPLSETKDHITNSEIMKPVSEIKADDVKQGDSKYKLDDVINGNATIEQFVAQLTDYDLACIASGEGMGSPLVTPGTAAAFAGVAKRLRELNIPAVCCADGPSGIRMDCGTKAFSLPNGTLLGCTFNTDLVDELYTFTGIELAANRIECLLGPGINIHRYPLNGRNFEYFSEDPVVTGAMAVAQLRAFKKTGVTGVLKHFCGNNQELGRRTADTVISQRALREIYLKVFEIAVKDGSADAIMSTYGVVNGIRTAECYDLCTKILRDEWGFSGIVMTDWWANISGETSPCASDGFALMLKSQNDLFMCTTVAEENDYLDRTLEMLKDDEELRAIMQRSAVNVCRFAMNTLAMQRLMGTATTYEIVGRKEEENQDDVYNLEYILLEDDLEYDLSYKPSKMGTNYIIPINVTRAGTYEITVTGNSSIGELAQIPCSLFVMGTPIGIYTFNGTNGKSVSIKRECLCFNHNAIFRLYVGGNGVNLEKIVFRFKSEEMNMDI